MFTGRRGEEGTIGTWSRKIGITLCAVAWLFLLQTEGEKTVMAEGEEDLSLYSGAAVLMDAETGQILYEKAGSQKMYPASITKIATGIAAIEYGDLNDEVLISEEAANVTGTSVYLLENETIPLEQLIQGMLINSGNDASYAIAEHIAGSEYDFSRGMTDYLTKKTGIENTSFTNPHGLHHDDHYTTAEDMAEITRYAMQNETFRDIVATKELDWQGEGWETTLRNHHQLLWDYEGTNGVKNGYVEEAGFTLVTSAKRDGRELIAVVLKAGSSQQAYQDTITLLNLGFHDFEEQYLAAGQQVKAQNGSVYTIPDRRSFSVPKGAAFEIKGMDNGQVVVESQDSEQIFTTYVPIETGTKENKSYADTTSKKGGNNRREDNNDSDMENFLEGASTTHWMREMITYQLKYATNFSKVHVDDSSS
ncbi:D-alanyl-D-alanine carboxypeptidase/D-alanyl-D-alanine carboxypeptidase (penicillin-binding protein 5/6) [Alteribacillus persepolensis]|uniref:D-alanyl-D-alanine carboxypeptidase/D-alanyl-D-alanine carboxypeptidase (Penicillin-binding protein 5/6) n=1 Tax=Alteribacillus persepolensis TaxID=568899 RepID=A0A1G8GLH8_9BACI|nr:D-alanyl-D-alanine carboxypeptidase family protein [Alteribacillus persepolensis]SDH95160.1 D-alanyl-D-alanine carboxypeptidase/D-alanyl-D-alanine carboxypeptidase (penicillin-binding protein 5/6) [Alteribacillus persepolensis]